MTNYTVLIANGEFPNNEYCNDILSNNPEIICVDTDQKLKKIYQSELFRNWCNTHRVTPDKLPLEFLIGQVQEHSDDMTSYIHKNFEGIEFIS